MQSLLVTGVLVALGFWLLGGIVLRGGGVLLVAGGLWSASRSRRTLQGCRVRLFCGSPAASCSVWGALGLCGRAFVRPIGYACGMSVFPVLSAEQMRRLAGMPAQELRRDASGLIARAEELEGEALWCRVQAAALNEAATVRSSVGNRSRGKAARRLPSQRSRASASKPPSTHRTGADPRLPDGLTREQLPRFGLREGEDPTGRKQLILGVMWISGGSTWSPPEMAAELQRTGLDPTVRRDIALTFLRRMAEGDQPRLNKLGKGRGARYELAADLRPIEQTDLSSTVPLRGDRR